MLESVTLDSFAPRVGAAFAVAGPDGAIEMVLERVDGLGAPAIAGGRAPFSLVFRGPPSPILPQATYAFVDATLGELEIFIVPIAGDARAATYQAIFT